MNLHEICKRLGYPKHTDIVYETLCKTTESQSVTELAKQAKLPRMTIYRCIEVLLNNELIEASQVGKRTFYVARNPRRLQQAMRLIERDSENALKSKISKFEKDVPSSIRFLKGVNGIRAAFDDVITHSKRGESFFRYTSEQDLAAVNRYLSPDYRLRRDQKKLERLVISNATSGSQKRSRLERFIKFIPAEADQFQQNIIQLVYGKRVSIIDLNKEEVVIIESQELANFQKVIFQLLYKRL